MKKLLTSLIVLLFSTMYLPSYAAGVDYGASGVNTQNNTINYRQIGNIDKKNTPNLQNQPSNNKNANYNQLMQPINLFDNVESGNYGYTQPQNTKAFDNMYQSFESKSPKYLQLSPIEEMFNGKSAEITGNPLRQIGYDLFLYATTPQNSQATTGKFDNSYKLNIGEKINVNLQGDSVDVMAISGSGLLNPSTVSEIDSKGNLFVQGIGSVYAEGKTIGEVQSSLNKLASSKYKNLKVQLSVASGQDFSVFVFGQVNKPGKILIGNNSSIFDAINAAGGAKKSGSLRNITYITNHKQKTVDLYKTILLGQDDGIILKPNDRIFVSKIGPVVAIKNGVIEPGIYETKEGESIQKLVNYAGGLAPNAQDSEVVLTSFDKIQKQKIAKNVEWGKIKSTNLKNGDSIEFKELYNEVENTVTIQGNIKHPATYAYKDGMKLSDILKDESELLEETFINQAVIRRISGDDNSIETIPVFLKDFFAGLVDPQLKPRDVISIYKNTNSDFIDVYGCINTPKHLTYTEGLVLYDVMSDIKFLESDIKADETEEIKDISVKQDENGVILSGGASNYDRLIPAEKIAVEITDQNGVTTLFYLYDIMVNSDKIKSIPIMPNDRIFFRTLRDNEIVKSVKISGFVKVPGVYTSIEGKKLKDIIEMAGGLLQDADLRGIVFKRSNLQNRQVEMARKNNDRDIKLLEGRIASAFRSTESEKETRMSMINMLKSEDNDLNIRYEGQIALNIKSNDLDKIKPIDNIEIQDGDTIYIPRVLNQVSVMGEVYNEQSFAYSKGAKAGKYIKEVGGYTPNANRFRLYKVGINGRAVKISSHSSITPGDIIIVPRKIAGNDWLSPVCEALKGIASLISTAFIVTRI